MKKMFTKLLSLSLAFLCLFSTAVTPLGMVRASGENSAKEGALEIKKGFTGGDSMLYFNEKVKGAVTVEYDIKFNQWESSKFGFGLISE